MRLRFILLLAILPIAARCAGERLIGVWTVDREATLKYATGFTEKERRAIEADPAFFDHFKIAFDDRSLCYQISDHTGAMEYRVVAESKSSVIVECPNDADENEERMKVTYTGTGIAFALKNTRFTLYFKKTNEKPNQALLPTATAVTPAAVQPPRQP